jgi:hypothetical protein
MVAMMTFCGARIKYTRLLFHLVGGDLVGGVEDGRCSSDRRLDGVVDIVWFTYVIGLVLQSSDQFTG